MTRVWHRYERWEEVAAGMWGDVPKVERQKLLGDAIKFTGDHKLYGSFMLKVADQWPISCEHNLTDVNQNRKAWIGHAACCLAIKCPEHITRQAWGFLSKEQQDTANIEAENAIFYWEEQYERRNRDLFKKMAQPWLPGWDSRGGPAKAGIIKQSAIISTGVRRNNEERCEPCQPWLHPSEVWGLYGT